MVDGTREKSSADQLLQKLGVVTTNAWEGERDREGGRLAQCNDCDGSQRSHHLVDTCFWTAALAFGPTSLLINIWWNKWWIFYDFFPFKFKLLWNTGAQKKKKKGQKQVFIPGAVPVPPATQVTPGGSWRAGKNILRGWPQECCASPCCDPAPAGFRPSHPAELQHVRQNLDEL